MNKKYSTNRLLWGLLLLLLSLGKGVSSGGVRYAPYRVLAGQDTTKVSAPPTIPLSYKDIERENPFDLRTPSQLKSEFVYDAKKNLYYYTTTLNGKIIGTPIAYTPEQYREFLQRNENRDYFLQKERQEAQEEGDKRFNPFDFGFELGPAERIFGPGGVRLKTQGSAEVQLGVQSNATDNPSMPENARNHTFFNFDERIQANVNASVGTKLNFNLNYNTESTFDFDSRRLKLAYEGEEDDIVKLVEAGNVSLQPRNSLIRGGASLFGIQTKLQFGNLDVNMVVSRQEAESKHVSAEGGVQTEPFEFSASNYDENRHFFLAHYFYEHYDEALETLPFISSGVTINRVEVWVTNRRGRFESARNIVAFSDLAEPTKIYNPSWRPTQASQGMPDNRANSLYETVFAQPGLRKIEQVADLLAGQMKAGVEYEKLESARRLSESEFTLNSQLGYITLNTRVGNDEIVAVAFEYTYKGKVYRVGEFASDYTEGDTQNLFVKLIKGTTLTPEVPYWKLCMRNVYTLGTNVRDLSEENFRLDVLYQSESAGMALPYLPTSDIKGQVLLRVLGLDRLDSRDEPYADGVFDYVDGYTVNSRLGLVYFNTVEPFGKTLAEKIGDPAEVQKYCYPELYETTAVSAKQVAEKNKFILRGEYKASQSGTISLGAIGVTPGSVRVTAGGVLLTENVDYTVNYGMGTVTIINESILNSGTRIDVSLENKGFAVLQRKTMLGMDLNYHFSPQIMLGGTIMYLSEMPLTTKTAVGNESLRNLLWGLNFNMDIESQRLTNILDFIPFLDLTTPSKIKFNAEFAHLIPGHYESKFVKGYSYVDDFEAAQGSVDLMNPYVWTLSSTPYRDVEPLFPEASLSNNLAYGYHRAKLAWFYIDPSFNRSRSSLMPAYMRNDPEYLSNHYSREVLIQELFPYRDYSAMALGYLSTLNLSYYPRERGPYNFNAESFSSDGTLVHPEENWAGIMRKIDQSDFEASNIEYIEFWLLDPFIYNPTSEGGDLYLNLGEVSEDILRDGLKFFENGLPINEDPAAVKETVWGKVPIRQASGYAFDNSSGARQKQDLGFNGLNDDEEKLFPSYQQFLNDLLTNVSSQTQEQWRSDPLSPLNDPAGDNFVHFRNSRYDEDRASILDRYKHYNGVQGNSAEATGDVDDSFSVASRVMPDVEDINQDNTLNEHEKYYSYRIKLSPGDLQVGSNHITDIRTSTVTLPNGKRESVNWYQFKVPIKNYDEKIGEISDFNSIRFIRLFLTGFKEEVFLRFGTFKLVRGTWRTYERPLYEPENPPATEGKMVVSTVNLEENGDREPVSYVLPPGVLRSLDPAQAQATQQNEQALSLKISKLASGDARAVYRNIGFDFRRYKRMELFAHAEQLIDDDTDTKSGDLSLFVRIGSDYTGNYYEYSVPLTLTPFGIYSSDISQDRYAVWPKENLISFDFDIFTDLKVERNALRTGGAANVDFYRRYTKEDPYNTRNSITVIGNPSLSNVKTIMIGVRNNANTLKSAEIWVNEFRLSDYREQGGMAANADMQVALSDWGSVNVRGQWQTAGFGALDETLNQRRLDDLRQVNISTRLDMGRFFPKKAKVNIPLYYAYNDELITPLYNPLDEDVLLKRALEATASKQERDSIFNHSVKRTTSHSLSLSNMKVDIKSEIPMPYDPTNFSFSYAYNTSNRHTPELLYDRKREWTASATYDYSPVVPPLKPFKGLKSKNRQIGPLKSYQINYLPSKISFATTLLRHYSEQQSRNFIPGVGDAMPIPATFVQNFIWDRSVNVNWNLTTNIQASFQSGTNARIEEPHVQVNRTLEPDKYKLWQDSVRTSIRQLGTPMKYDQRATLSYKLPFAQIPYMQWISGTASYTGTYNWDRGAILASGISVGNVIRNDMRLDGNITFNFSSLYREIPFLNEVEKAVSQGTERRGARSQRGRRVPDPRRTPENPTPDAEESSATRSKADGGSARPGMSQGRTQAKQFSKDVTLSADSATIVHHGLGDKKLDIQATTEKGNRYRLKTKILDENKIEILNRDTLALKVTIRAKSKKKESRDRSLFVNHLLYSVIMIRDVNITYRRSQSFNIPGFMPDVGDFGGQQHSEGGLAPGLDFAFGFVGRNFIQRAAQMGWLTTSEDNVNPSTYTQGEDLSLRVTLEPLKDLRITLTAMRNDTRREETQFVFEGMPKTFGGSFTMTTIGLKDLFKTSKADGGYYSQAFQNLLDYRGTIARRIEAEYIQNGVDIKDYTVKQNSADVLIPAFMAAYASYSSENVELSPFPSLGALLPNWSISYTGLSRLPGINKLFRSFTLSHTYNATYSIGSYNSILGWEAVGERLGDRGFISQVAAPDPSTGVTNTEGYLALPYDIPTVTMQEGFNPLLGVEMTFANGIGMSCRWNRRRTLNLSPLNAQITENADNEISASLNYKVEDVRKLFGRRNARRRPARGKFNLFSTGGSLTLRLDYSYNRSSMLIRKIQENFTQATNGNSAHSIKCSADYGLSRYITLRAFLDWRSNQPLVSTASFPTRNLDFGVSIRISLTQ